MKRKITLMMFAVFVATLMAVALTPVAFGQEIKLTYANFPPAPTFPCVQMERWAKEVDGSLFARSGLDVNGGIGKCSLVGGHYTASNSEET